MDERSGFIEKFVSIAALYPNVKALEDIDTGASYSYAEMKAQVEIIRAYLTAEGVKPADVVLVMLPSCCPHWVLFYYAVCSLGAVACPIKTSLTEYEILACLAQVKVDHAIYELNKVSQAKKGLLLDHGIKSINGGSDYIAELNYQPQPLTAIVGNPVISCNFTYKGLGYPLAVEHRYHDYTAVIEGHLESFPQSVGARHLVCMPLFNVFGLVDSVLTPLSTGCHLLLMPKISFKMLDCIFEQEIEVFPCVPPILKLLVSQAQKSNRRLHRSFILGCGGSSLSSSLELAVSSALGVPVYQGYGTTEVLPVTFNHPESYRFGSLGKPLSEDVSISIRDSEGGIMSANQVGEICVAGASVATGFVGSLDASSRYFSGQFFKSGDLGYLDENGFLFFTGIRNPFTKIAAQMVDLREVEECLIQHPDVKAAFVKLRKDAGKETVLEANILPVDKERFELDTVSRFLKKRLSPHKVPKKYWVSGEYAKDQNTLEYASSHSSGKW